MNCPVLGDVVRGISSTRLFQFINLSRAATPVDGLCLHGHLKDRHNEQRLTVVSYGIGYAAINSYTHKHNRDQGRGA
jgi:hypothetical protein